jgi:hypothetical protein
MIQGIKNVKLEADYRKLPLDSSSSLKDFSLDRKKYLKKYILNEIVEEKDTQASVMGRVVETLLLEKNLFDSRFYMSACASAPTGLMNDFIEALYVINRLATDEEGNITRSFEEMSREAYTVSGFKITYEAVIKKFIGSDNEIYYNEIRQVRANNLTVVTTNDVTNAERIVEELKTNPITKNIVNLVSSNRYTVQNQFQVEGYNVGGHLFKSMMDKIVIDHQERTLQVFDLKCVWAVENFFEEYFLYRRAYIQGYLYYRAAQSLTIDPEKELYGYKVLPPKFIVCDSINYYSPLIYAMSEEDLADALLGFEYKGKKYPGVKIIIEELTFALDNKIWNISRENYLTNGIVSLRK